MTSTRTDNVADHYVEHFVAFIDILGYSQIVLEVKDSADALSKIMSLKAAVDQAERTLVMRTGWQRSDASVRILSDSIIVAIKATMDNFDAFFQLIAEAQANLARRGVLVRGGVAIGRHYEDEKIVFSEGLIKAYTLESTAARFPRVLVPGDFWDYVTRNGHDEDIIWFRDLYTWRDAGDGELFIDYLNFMPFTRRHEPNHNGRDLRNHRELIVAGLAAHAGSPNVLTKFRWLATYHNEWCSDQCPEHPDLLIHNGPA